MNYNMGKNQDRASEGTYLIVDNNVMKKIKGLNFMKLNLSKEG